MADPVTSGRPAGEIIVSRDYGDLCAEAAQRILTLSEQAISQRGRFTLALSGGSTPKGVYALMAGHAFAWDKIHFFFGDERWVPANDTRSNFCMVNETLFTKVRVPAKNINAVQTKTPDPETSASLYAKELKSFFGVKTGDFPVFDLVLLGLGPEGHTASLFPGSPALDETKHLAVATEKENGLRRITLTLPVLNNAANIFFLVSGAEKAAIFKRVLSAAHSGTPRNPLLPAEHVYPPRGKLHWLVDQPAARFA